MLATASIPGLGPQAMPSGDGDDLSAFTCQMMTSSGSVSPPTSPHSSASLTLHASATATPVTDMELTNLGWLQKPGVLSSMCTALGDAPQQQQQQLQHSKMGAPVRRRPRQPKSNESRKESAVSRSSRSSDKMVNVILNARNRKYDGGDVIKPPLSFACMIFMAVESSPTKTLPVKEIYDWVMWKFPYYRSAPPGWKNSVRHNLSLHKCFKKVERRYSLKSGSAVTKGGLWTVDPDYRRSLLSALKRTPYHPYHSYFTPPLSPSSSNSSLETVDPAERDAALTMCMISGSSEQSDGTPDLLHAVIHDHCYTKCPVLPVPSPPDSPCPQVTVKLNTGGRSRRKSNKSGLTLDEIAAAAELILAQDDADDKQETSGSESSDEGFGGEVESDSEEDPVTNSTVEDLADSGYGAGTTTPTNTMELSSALDEMGADALLCLATGTKSTS